MALHLDPGELEPSREGDGTELVPGTEEKRELSRTWEVAGGTFACPACDVPVAFGGAITLGATLACPYCDRSAPARDYLSLTDEPRPARVRVVATLGRSPFGDPARARGGSGPSGAVPAGSLHGGDMRGF
jgi:hypothetical protein